MTKYSGALSRLKPLFAADHPNRSMLVSFLNGEISGQCYVDTDDNPSFCLVVLGFLRWSFAGGNLEHLAAALAELTKTNDLTLVWNPGAGDPPTGFVEQIARAEFSQTDFEALNRVPSLAGDFEIVPMDEGNFASSLWRDLLLLGYGSDQNYLSHAKGFSLAIDGKTVSDVYVSFFAEGSYELGVVTAEEYRRKGFSFEVSRHGINEAHRRGYRTTWSCDRDNPASFELARKLAYSHLREYEMFFYAVTPSP